MVDLRCHGDSASIGSLPGEPHNVQTSAGDVLALLRQMKLFPEVLVGHSFGGKVVMSMAQQFGQVGMRLPRPVQVLNRQKFATSGRRLPQIRKTYIPLWKVCGSPSLTVVAGYTHPSHHQVGGNCF